MGYHNKNNWNLKYKRYAAALLLVLSFMAVGRGVLAAYEGVLMNTGSLTGNGADFLLSSINDPEAASAALKCEISVGCLRTESGYDCSRAMKALNKCVQDTGKNNAKLQNSSQWKEYAKRIADLAAKEAKQEALAIAFKTSLSTFARQVAHDTAVWVASGGRGQKPLFITEGWGAYLENAADAALGDFISKIGTVYGVNLCQPTFQIRIAIQAGLDYRQQNTRTCSLSTMANNWKNAISSDSFAIDYRNAMGAGENDITYMLILGDERELAISGSVNAKAKEAETNSMWKDIKNAAGVILTPGTFIKKQFFDSQDSANASIGYSTFTGTVADVIEEFLNTLVAQLLKQLQSGFFSGSGGGTGSSQSLGTIDLSSLFNSDSSPSFGEGAESAKLQYASLIAGQTKIGSKLDILLKLSQCSDEAKSNPGPTDCVIDSVLQSAIKNKKYLIDLPDSVKNRIFAPKINQTASLDSVIPSRSITILRKYSIVPVGWEFAAQVAATLDKDVTLGQIMDCFYYTPATAATSNCVDSRLAGLIDPYWVLKAPEEFCRQVGYSGRNTLKKDQSGAISRDQDCVDEQQCLQEDDKGNCLNYGYCTEQRRTWDLGTTCSTKYNTCSSFTSRLGDKGNWLANTLDFASCSSQNAGCRSYATDLNYPSAAWNGEFIEGGQIKKYSIALDGADISAVYGDSSWSVPVSSSTSRNGRLKISQPCSAELCSGGYDVSGCVWQDASKSCSFARSDGTTSCLVPRGGFSCVVDNCFDTKTNLLAGKNYNFASYESGDNSNATFWTDELSVLNSSDRHFRSEAASDKHGASNSLKLAASGNESQLITTLPNIPVDSAGKYYLLKFYAKGSAGSNAVSIAVYNGSASLYGNNPPASLSDVVSLPKRIDGWQEYSLYFNSAGVSTATIAIITAVGSITDQNVTDFRLYQMTDVCQKTSVQLFTQSAAVSSPRTSPNIYFNRNVSTCSVADEGCSQFIRLKPGLGSNLLANGSFEYTTNDLPTEWHANSGVMRLSASNEPVRSGAYSLAVTSGLAAVSSSNIPTELLAGKKYALSGYVYSPNANSALRADVVDASNNLIGAANIEVSSGELRAWKRFEVAFDVAASASSYSIRLSNQDSNVAYYDDIKFEQLTYKDTDATAYSSYDPSLRAVSQVSYLKKAPDSFNCYLTSSKTWPTTAAQAAEVAAARSSACSSYSPVCAKEEVGCELYTPTNGDPAVPGVATDLDLCPSECNGYKIYKQEETNFATSTYRQFIADSKAKYCSAAYAGCDEFTNLDDVGSGGEKKEYYTSIKACQKPSIDDASYYTWEGSDTTGYQLKAFNLKRSDAVDSNNGGSGYAPCTNLTYAMAGFEGQPKCQEGTLGPSGLCTKADMLSNDDCREFYDANGYAHTRLASLTVTVSDNCHPYRRTQTQTVINDAKIDCQGSHGYWNANSECIYMAIPSEGGVCSAAAKGCREYTGNTGNNVRYVINALNFSTTLNNLSWRDANDKTDGLFISAESTFTGGSSLSNKSGYNTLKYPVVIQKNKAYSLSFWAKGNRNFNIQSIAFKDAPGTDYFARSSVDGGEITKSAANIKTDWNKYDLGPVFVTWDPGESSEFIITLGSGDQIYLDNLVLKELNDSIFAVENSWYTPQSCDNALNDASGDKAVAAGTCTDKSTGRCSPGEMLGCSSYKDRSGTAWYLKSFTSLCRREAAGCEALIDTANSNSPYSATYGAEEATSTTIVPKDSLVYMVNDSAYACSSGAKGCRAVGLPNVDRWDQITSYATLFLINDPEKYSTDLCKDSELWCEEYNKDNSGLVYFKNPGSKSCDYNATDNKWYKTGTTIECVTSANMTIGTGYDPVLSKLQPQGPYDNAISATTKSAAYSGFVGNCPASEATCSEYVDPYPEIYSNLIPNKFNDRASATLSVKANALYYVVGLNISTPATDGCGISPSVAGKNLYYLRYGSKDKCNIVISPGTGDSVINTKSVSTNVIPDKIAYAGVYYAKASTVDNSSCNGMVNYKTGCILINSRADMDFSTSSLAGRYQKSLVYDSQTTYKNNLNNLMEPVSVAPTVADKTYDPLSADSNVIVKASANRTCAKWLSCTTYQKTNDSAQDYRFENTDKCLNISVCSAKDEQGNCIQYETSTVAVLDKSNANPGTSGFAIPGYLPLDAMDQWGQSANVPNGNFESVMSSTNEPAGWNITASSSDLNIDGWQSYKYSVDTKQQYLKFDSGYLKMSGVYGVNSDPIDVEKGQYVLDFWVNTLQLTPDTASATVFIAANATNLNNTNFFGQSSTGVKTVKIDGRNWKTSNELQIGPGLGWVERSVIINIASTDDLTIKLMNLNDPLVNGADLDSASSSTSAVATKYFPNYYNCYDLATGQRGSPNYATPCNLGGSASDGTMFDNISLRPVLKIKGTSAEPLTGELIGRTCRAYPAQDGRSCQYYQDSKFYYGWYGYCLTEDPQNPGQCLQWYPIDELKGDVVDEYSAGYKDRQPLYYCIEAKRTSLTVSAYDQKSGMGSGFSDRVGINDSSVVSSVVKSIVGKDMKTIQFAFDNPVASRLLRYPMMQRFAVKALAGGIGLINNSTIGVGIIPYFGTMEKDRSCFKINAGEACPKADESQALNQFANSQSDNVSDIVSTLSSDVSDAIGSIAGMLGIDPNLPLLTGKKISSNSQWGGWGDVVIAAVGGGGIAFALGLPIGSWDVVEEALSGSSTNVSQMLNGLFPDFNGVAFDGSVMGAKIVLDTDSNYADQFTDPNPNIKGDILGVVWGFKTGEYAAGYSGINVYGTLDTYYCTKIVEVVTSMGQNKAWTNRVSQGSQFSFLDSDKPSLETQSCDPATPSAKQSFFKNPYCLNYIDPATSAGLYDGIDPTKLGYQFDGYGADYAPYGAIVAPSADSQNPSLWDSYIDTNGLDLSRQPIYWEPPLTSLTAPYQPRMGQPVLKDSLKQLFAKAYRSWTWVSDPKVGATAKATDDHSGYYKQDSDASSIWDVPTADCASTLSAKEKAAYIANGYVRDVSAHGLQFFCRIAPEIITMKINSSTSAVLNSTKPARLDFTVRVDKDQLPLTSYAVNWGDGDDKITSISGVKLRAKSNPENPFTLYHLYDFQRLWNQAGSACTSGVTGFSAACPTVYCSGSECTVRINIRATDNWRTSGNATSTDTGFGLTIKVTQD